jgi:hypothetical protein
MTAATTHHEIRRLDLRGRWARLRQSDGVEDLLREFLHSTAVWGGFPLSRYELQALHRPGRRREE